MLARIVSIRGGALLGALAIIAVTAMIAATCGQIMATALGAPGPGRFGDVDAIAMTDPTFHIGGPDGDPVTVPRAVLLPAPDVARAAAVPGVRSAVPDIAFPVTIAAAGEQPLTARGARPADAHGWSSASLGPFRLLRGTAPQGQNGVVLDAGLVAT